MRRGHITQSLGVDTPERQCPRRPLTPRIRGVYRLSADIRCAPKQSLTFELRSHRRQDARPGPVKMYSVPPPRAWWPAVGGPLERGVRSLCGEGYELGGAAGMSDARMSRSVYRRVIVAPVS